ncbi:MAG: bifunctional diguanylate cyclase/phosphodiesterase [Lachnospiraceae bacterium]|nr:bifunctional diguanylate cyclase/phosphodiesterase [Lachnospiraceae bacterium]
MEETTSLKQGLEYTWKNVNTSLNTMRGMFDIVRLVDAEECREIFVTEEGKLQFGDDCYSVWSSDHRCANCTSLQACRTHKIKNRSEIYNGRKFEIRSMPATIELSDGILYSCTLELINYIKLSDEEADSNMESKTDKETESYFASHDGLTELYNWDGFCKSSRKLMMEEPDRQFLIMAANIRNFKLVNSLFGHSKGDEVLMEVAGILVELCEKGGTCGRNNNDIFAICIPKDLYNESILMKGIKNIRNLIDSPSYRMNIHFGLYEVQDKDIPISIMFDRAYMALQTIRDNRDKVVAKFNDTMLKAALHEQEVISDFEKNLRSGQFVIYLQPQVSNAGRIEGAECLVRWILPDGKMVPPYEFIGILEQSDLIASLDKYVWELAVKQLDVWRDTPYKDMYLSINVSPQDFYYLDVADTIHELCVKYNVPPSKLRVEITETAVADEMQDNLAALDMLHEYGFIVEIDDFGKGSSSLSLLKDIPADVLKIDMGFLRNSENSKRGIVILRSVIGMAKGLGMDVISEGVETETQMKDLTDLGCNMFQGYFFSKPIPVAAFEKMADECM